MAHTHYTEKAVAVMIRRREEWRLVIVIGWRRGRESEHNIISPRRRKACYFLKLMHYTTEGGEVGLHQ